MRDEAVEREMYRRAVQLIETRYPTGWGGAGVVHTPVSYTHLTLPTIA